MRKQATLEREGDYWTVTADGGSVRIRDSKGLRYLAALVSEPGRELTPLELVAAVDGVRGQHDSVAGDLAVGGLGDAGPVLDREARTAYAGRVAELREEIESAERFNDPERAIRARAELSAVADELASATGRGGRTRRTHSQSERARVNVTRAIRSAIAKVSEHHRTLAEELDAGVRTGGICCYRPSATDTFELSAGTPANRAAVALVHETAFVRPDLPSDLVRASERPIIGREDALELLTREWERALEGRGRLVLVAGEAGIGKTRLAAELATDVHARGAIVLFGRCDEEPVAPYQPFVQMLRHYARPNSAQHAGAASAQLRRLVPELDAPVQVETGARDPETERYLLFEDVTAYLTAAADHAPAVVVVDDLHWADRPTVLLLRHLQRAAVGKRLLVVATVRPDEPPWPDAHRTVVAQLAREGLLVEAALPGLPFADTVALLEQSASVRVSAEKARVVWERTEGNPFFVRETARHLTESQDTIPASVRDVLERRLSRLSDGSLETLRIASVVGVRFELVLLERVLADGSVDVVGALDEAVRLGALREQSGTLGAYSFSHALMRAALYDALGQTQQARLHKRVAEGLESLRAAERGQFAELALHFRRAASEGDPEKAVRYAVAAAQLDVEHLAYESAADHYRSAIAALTGPDAESQRLELTLALGDAEWRAGRVPTAREVYRSALDLAESNGTPEQFALAALGFGFGEGVAQTEAALVDEELVAALKRALARLPEEDSALRARVMSQLASALTYSPDTEHAAALVRDAVAMARRLRDPRTLASVLLPAHAVSSDPADVRQKIDATSEVCRVAEALEDDYTLALASSWRSVHNLQAGAIDESDADLERLEQLSEQLKIPTVRFLALTLAAGRAQQEGRLEEAEQLVQQFFELGQESYNANAAAQAGAILMMIRFEQQRADEILPAIEQFSSEVGERIPWRHARMAALAETDRLDDARAILEGFVADDFPALERNFSWTSLIAWTAEVCALAGAPPGVERLYQALLPFEDQCAHIWFGPSIGSVAGYLGAYAHQLGDLERASAHFERALQTNARLRAWPYLALTQVRFANLSAEVGDQDRAAALRAEAAATADRLDLARVRRLLS